MDKSQQAISLKDFQILKELGTGSYGRVQLVKRKQDKQLYAMKSMFLANAKQKQKAAALNQIRLLASIRMPYVIGYKCSFYCPEIQSLCIVMEYADGGDLQSKISARLESFGYSGFEEPFIWKCAHQILKGLKGLHEHNIIHRDMKCANIFFVQGVAKLGDLNISKITDNGFASTQTGTPYYTSPEIWNGQKYSSRCDIWALGCIIYEMCTLLPPFRAQDFPGLFQSITKGVYEDIPKKYTQSLRQFICLCLKVDPEVRPSAANLLEQPYFSQFQLTRLDISSQLQSKSSITLIDPIQCPKMLKTLNEKLPKPKFLQTTKKTVCFAESGPSSASSFKIKTKKFRSEKTITLTGVEETAKQQRCEIKPVPTFVQNRSNKQLPPLQKERQAYKRPKTTKTLRLKEDTLCSMKCIGAEKENRRRFILK